MNEKDIKSWHCVFLICALLVCPIKCNSVCEVSEGSSLDWKTAGLTIANTMIGYIPKVGPWLALYGGFGNTAMNKPITPNPVKTV